MVKKYLLKVLAIASEFVRMVLLSMMALGDCSLDFFVKCFLFPSKYFSGLQYYFDRS